jgi:hypothetical protein
VCELRARIASALRNAPASSPLSSASKRPTAPLDQNVDQCAGAGRFIEAQATLLQPRQPLGRYPWPQKHRRRDGRRSLIRRCERSTHCSAPGTCRAQRSTARSGSNGWRVATHGSSTATRSRSGSATRITGLLQGRIRRAAGPGTHEVSLTLAPSMRRSLDESCMLKDPLWNARPLRIGGAQGCQMAPTRSVRGELERDRGSGAELCACRASAPRRRRPQDDRDLARRRLAAHQWHRGFLRREGLWFGSMPRGSRGDRLTTRSALRAARSLNRPTRVGRWSCSVARFELGDHQRVPSGPRNATSSPCLDQSRPDISRTVASIPSPPDTTGSTYSRAQVSIPA